MAAEKLVLALRSVAAGASWWDETATKEIRSTFASAPSQSQMANLLTPENPLTHREQEILSLLAVKKTNQEIALALYITPGTVRVHIHTILHKLGVADRQTAVVIALQKRLIKSNLIVEE
ncbi:response regulator transcription factor [Nostoc flagelliforme FACHB-838]|uniref:Response regulator transcription factor n=1 Tax=Nostoc flagelliforme FACHB-838 TaxID=2692904 RepID=A0ABR8E537_9NOSO|nr:response regulator transcription factor [Nostoc flagelliforme FACHB-838]